MIEDKLKKLIGKSLSEIPQVIHRYYPMIDQSEKVVNFVSYTGELFISAEYKYVKYIKTKDAFRVEPK